jgi:hypothetical protein
LRRSSPELLCAISGRANRRIRRWTKLRTVGCGNIYAISFRSGTALPREWEKVGAELAMIASWMGGAHRDHGRIEINDRVFTNCRHWPDKPGMPLRQAGQKIRVLIEVFTPSVTWREWGNRGSRRRGWGRRFFIESVSAGSCAHILASLGGPFGFAQGRQPRGLPT